VHFLRKRRVNLAARSLAASPVSTSGILVAQSRCNAHGAGRDDHQVRAAMRPAVCRERSLGLLLEIPVHHRRPDADSGIATTYAAAPTLARIKAAHMGDWRPSTPSRCLSERKLVAANET
jgi:hypothetical protein